MGSGFGTLVEDVQSRPISPAALILSSGMHGGPRAPVHESTCKLPCATALRARLVPRLGCCAAIPAGAAHIPHPAVISPCRSGMREPGNSSASWTARDSHRNNQCGLWLLTHFRGGKTASLLFKCLENARINCAGQPKTVWSECSALGAAVTNLSWAQTSFSLS